jgi:hypothetical protein
MIPFIKTGISSLIIFSATSGMSSREKRTPTPIFFNRVLLGSLRDGMVI